MAETLAMIEERVEIHTPEQAREHAASYLPQAEEIVRVYATLDAAQLDTTAARGAAPHAGARRSSTDRSDAMSTDAGDDATTARRHHGAQRRGEPLDATEQPPRRPRETSR